MEGLCSFERVKLCLIGPFRVWGPKGQSLTPRGQKSCALLALLALSPGLSRSRASLQDKLWSDRGEEQGSASLRQALSEVRRALGPYRDCLITDGRLVSLARDRVVTDLEAPSPEALGGPLHRRRQPTERPVLLEDLDIRDKEFEHWLRDQRLAFEQSVEAQEAAQAALPAMAKTSVARADGATLLIERARPARPWVRILPATIRGSETGVFLSQVISQSVAQGIRELAAVDVCDLPRDTPGIDLKIDVHPLPTVTAVHLSLRSAHDQQHLWSGTHQITDLRSFRFDSTGLKSLINNAIDIAVMQLHKLASTRDDEQASALGFEAVQRMFRIDMPELLSAEQLLDLAFERQPSGVFLAWKAFLRTFYIGEDRGCDRQAVAEEAKSLARDALQLEPYNAYVLALTSYVHSFILRNYAAGHDLAERSLKLSPSNPLALAFLGRVKSYLGEYEEGYRLAAAAREVAGPGPYRGNIDLLCSITAAVAGRHEEAIRLGEIVAALEPNYRPQLRYLLALYLKNGDRSRARQVFQKLKDMEPDFSIRLMREQFYPSTGLRQSGLLDFSEGEEFT